MHKRQILSRKVNIIGHLISKQSEDIGFLALPYT